MKDNDSFRLLSTDAAVVLACVIFGVASLFIGDDKERAPKLEQAAVQTKSRTVPCATIEQYGPGERWIPTPSRSPDEPACAGATFDPPHVLTSPIKVSQ